VPVPVPLLLVVALLPPLRWMTAFADAVDDVWDLDDPFLTGD
jgi:hypothetical protein